MKPVVKDVMHDLRKLLPVAEQALSTQTMKLDERVTAISQWRELTSPAMITVLLDRIDQLEKLWTEPTEEMVNTGIAEVQTTLEQWIEDHWELDIKDLDQIPDSAASDMAVFTLQAMASKLPKDLV